MISTGGTFTMNSFYRGLVVLLLTVGLNRGDQRHQNPDTDIGDGYDDDPYSPGMKAK
jgi:hypothetical protein